MVQRYLNFDNCHQSVKRVWNVLLRFLCTCTPIFKRLKQSDNTSENDDSRVKTYEIIKSVSYSLALSANAASALHITKMFGSALPANAVSAINTVGYSITLSGWVWRNGPPSPNPNPTHPTSTEIISPPQTNSCLQCSSECMCPKLSFNYKLYQIWCSKFCTFSLSSSFCIQLILKEESM